MIDTNAEVTKPQHAAVLSHVAIEQTNPKTGAIESNLAHIAERVEAAKARGAKLIVLPELAVTGYCLSDLVEDRGFLQANKEALTKLAEISKDIAIVVGFIDYDANDIQPDGYPAKWNSAAIINNGEITTVNKQNLPNYGMFDDKRFFRQGDRSSVVAVKIGDDVVKLGVAICEDIWDQKYKAKPVTDLAEQGAELIVSINASPSYPGKFEVREEIVRRHVGDHHIPFIYANTVGAADIGKTIVCFDGDSFAFNADGQRVALASTFAEASLDVDLLSKHEVARTVPSREQHIFEGLTMVLRDYAKKSGFTKALVPLSGGIDSALGLAIACEAFGPDNVTAFNMPSKFNTDTTKGIAAEIAENFGCNYRVIPIQAIDNLIRETYQEHVGPIEKGVTKENIHPRIRGLIAMLEANENGELLISCGNKTEIALGYSTIYGDMCGGISIIGDLDKEPDVYAVAAYVNERYGREMLPRGVFEIKASAELSEGQYDPFDYSVVGPLVREFIVNRRNHHAVTKLFAERELNFPLDRSGKSVYDKLDVAAFAELADRTYKLFRRSVFKREQGAPIPAITERSLGRNLREPIINGWDG